MKASEAIERDIDRLVLSDKQIDDLRAESASSGDLAQAMICDIATGAIDPSDGYEHLRTWSLLSRADRRRIAEIDSADEARSICASVIAAGRG